MSTSKFFSLITAKSKSWIEKELKTGMKYLYQIRGNLKLIYIALKLYAAQITHHLALLKSPVLKE